MGIVLSHPRELIDLSKVGLAYLDIDLDLDWTSNRYQARLDRSRGGEGVTLAMAKADLECNEGPSKVDL